MKIVIDIPEKDYLAFCLQFDNGILDEKTPSHRAKIAIANGTPLPKGHGALKDENEIIAEMRSTFDTQDLYLPIHFKSLLVGVPTIVEADKEGAEDER